MGASPKKARKTAPDRHGGARNDVTGDEKIAKPERLHGRHVLNRYEDGMEKCIGCELCAGVCPAKCIYVRGADNDPTDPTSPGERFGFVYEINYLRCIHCDLCVEACPTEAITESKLFEFSFTSRRQAIYTKAELVVDDDGKPQQLPWEDWREGEDAAHQRVDARHRRRRATPTSSARSAGAASSATASASPSRTDVADRRCGTVAPLMELFVFVIAAAMMLVGAVGVIIRTHPVHAALSLILTLFGVAVLFVAQDAHFLAAVQVIVYAGAIVVLFLFVIMLLGVDDVEDLRIEPFQIQRPLAAIVGVGARRPGDRRRRADPRRAAARRRAISADIAAAAEAGAHDANIRALARDLFSDHVFAFELTSVLLVIAVVGTVLLVRAG